MAAENEHKDLSEAALTARLREAAKKDVPFAFALSKSSKKHHLVLHKVKEGKSLLAFLQGKQKDAGKGTWGTARLTPQGLVLDCAKDLSGIATAAKVWVQEHRHPKVKKIKVLVGGTEVEDEEATGAAPDPKAVAQAMATWQSAQKTAVGQLSRLGKAIAGTKRPEAKRLLVLLKAIQANLTAKPDTPQKVAELERYLKTDDIIADAESPNPFGFPVSLRKPLLAALAPLRSALDNS